MKIIQEQADNYVSELSAEFFSKEDLKTAYVTGAIEAKILLPNMHGTFGQAIQSLKQGKLVTRKGWNGKGMFLFIRPSDKLPTHTIVNIVKSLPSKFKEWVATNYGDKDTDNMQFASYICMKAADNTIVNGWLASQTDMLADDWMIFEY